jgi:hypothetical protein
MTVEIHGSLPDSLLEKASLPELLVRAAHTVTIGSFDQI